MKLAARIGQAASELEKAEGEELCSATFNQCPYTVDEMKGMIGSGIGGGGDNKSDDEDDVTFYDKWKRVRDNDKTNAEIFPNKGSINANPGDESSQEETLESDESDDVQPDKNETSEEETSDLKKNIQALHLHLAMAKLNGKVKTEEAQKQLDKHKKVETTQIVPEKVTLDT